TGRDRYPREGAEPARFELLAQSALLEQLAAGRIDCGCAKRADDAFRVCRMSRLAQQRFASLRQVAQKLPFIGHCRAKGLCLTAEGGLLRDSQPVSCFEQRANLVGIAPRKLVHGPQGDRGLPELLDPRGAVDLACLLEPLREVITCADEALGRRGVKVV